MKSVHGLYLHLDPVSGIAGDMTVAALVDAGVPEAVVADSVAAVGIPGLSVRFQTRKRGAFVGRAFIVDEPGTHGHTHGHSHAHGHDHDHGHDEADHGHEPAHQPGPPAAISRRRRSANNDGHHQHRDYSEIRRLLTRAKLDPDAKALANEIFARLAEVEAALHGCDLDHVTFHEVGAFDSIADIVGMSAAIAWLAPSSIGSTPPFVGTGTIHTAHGIVPVPAPATAALLRGIPMISEGEGELTTPTGAALLATVVDAFGPPPPLQLVSVGYGAGSRVLHDRANVLRAMLGQPLGAVLRDAANQVVMVESNIDDMSGQLLAALCEALFKAGALDVWSTPIAMKKGRPAQQISALCDPTALLAVERAFFLNSTTLGLRIRPVSRRTLSRSIEQVKTAFGPVDVKIAALDGSPIGATPEYEDCRRRAAASGVPVQRVWLAAVGASAHLVPSATKSLPGPRSSGARARPKRGRRPA